MADDKFAFLNEESFPWKKVLRVLFLWTLFLAACHLLHNIVWGGGRLPKFVAVFPLELWSIPAIVLGNFFHANLAHLGENLLVFWLVGLWAFKQEKKMAFWGMFWGALFCGAAQWRFGVEGSQYLGFSGIVFSLVGVLIVSCIRIGAIAIVPMCLGVYFLFIERTGTLSLWPSESTKGLSWQGHLGGLMGGMYSQIKDPGIALRVLAGSGWMTPNEAKVIHNRMKSLKLPELDKEEPEKSDDTDKEKPAPDKD